MTTITKYQANDGRIFDTEKECLDYEEYGMSLVWLLMAYNPAEQSRMESQILGGYTTNEAAKDAQAKMRENGHPWEEMLWIKRVQIKA